MDETGSRDVGKRADLVVVALVSAASAAYINKRTQRAVDSATEGLLGVITGALDGLTAEVATVGQAEAIVARACRSTPLKLVQRAAAAAPPSPRI